MGFPKAGLPRKCDWEDHGKVKTTRGMEIIAVGIVDDILKALDRIPAWKRLQELPSEVEGLKARIAVLEEKLGDTWPPDICRRCGKRALRLWYTMPQPNDQGYMVEDWKCEECGKVDPKVYKPSTR
jgi:hypothetical protein